MEQIDHIEVRGFEVILVQIDELHNLQPESFKELTDQNYAKLRNVEASINIPV